MRVAFIGLGRMGLPMASNLVAAGYDVVGCDIDPAKAAAFAGKGGRVAANAGAASAEADITLSILMNDAILLQVATQVFDGARPHHLYVDLSTVSPAASAAAGVLARAAGGRYLCAKVAGSVGLAESAGLTLFASGARDDFDSARAVFDALCAKLYYVGEGDAAAYLKLVHSMIVGTYSAMIGEALAFGQKGGLTLETMLDILEAGPLGSRQLTLKTPMLKARAYDNPPSDIDTAAKDVDLILDTARRDKTPLPLMASARQMMAAAQASGGGKREIYSILATFEQFAGLPREAIEP